MFFSTVGLSARAKLLLQGGKIFLILIGVTVVFLVCQNLTGILGAGITGMPLGAGLLAGTISFAGGHGTAVTWGTLAEEAGFAGSVEFGLAAATLGLIAGGVVGGPIAHRLIKKYRLQGEPARLAYTPGSEESTQQDPITPNHLIHAMFLIALCIGLGLGLQEGIRAAGIIVPDFLPVLLVGVLLTNLIDALKIRTPPGSLSLLSDVSLQIFLSISLMSLQLEALRGVLGPLAVILSLQVLTMFFFARYIVFFLSGRNYDAAVIAAGFSGLGLGATPVGIANMQAVTEKYGASPKAFFIIPLIGAFLLDIANALIIQGFLKLPIFG